MTFRLANTSLNTVSYSSLYMLYGLSDEMYDVGNVVCYGSDILRMWDLGDVRYSGCGMFRMWNVRDVGRLLGCRMLIYKMPHKGN